MSFPLAIFNGYKLVLKQANGLVFFFGAVHFASIQQSNRFRPYTTLNLHNDVNWDLNCIAGHLKGSKREERTAV